MQVIYKGREEALEDHGSGADKLYVSMNGEIHLLQVSLGKPESFQW